MLRPEPRPEHALRVPEVPGRDVPVPPPAVRVLLELRARDARPCAPTGRAVLHLAPGPVARPEEVRAEAGQLREAARHGERAPRLRKRAAGKRSRDGAP